MKLFDNDLKCFMLIFNYDFYYFKKLINKTFEFW